MFYLCDYLKGGNGTIYNSGIIDKTYAVLDSGLHKGYLSYKGDVTEIIELPNNGILYDSSSSGLYSGMDYLNFKQGGTGWVISNNSLNADSLCNHKLLFTKKVKNKGYTTCHIDIEASRKNRTI